MRKAVVATTIALLGLINPAHGPSQIVPAMILGVERGYSLQMGMPSGNGRRGNRFVSYYRDNPPFLIDRRSAPEFAMIGELETIQSIEDGEGNETRFYGTGVLISPCYVLTNYHVVFNRDYPPHDYHRYIMTFRVGVDPTQKAAFLGRTIATPVVWGDLGIANQNDWAILVLKTCVGGRPDVGWMDTSIAVDRDLTGEQIVVAGYAGRDSRGTLSLSIGRADSVDPVNRMIQHSASVGPGQSGAPVLIREGGQIKLVGVDTLEYVDRKSGNNEFHTYSRYYANEFTDIRSVLMRTDVREMLRRDRAAYRENPAAPFLRAEWPKSQAKTG